MKDQRRLRRPFTSAGLAQTLKRTRAGIEQLGFGTYHQKDWLVHQDWRLALQCFPIIQILADMSIDTGERVLGHGDFKANNLLITPRIVILDWLSMGQAPPWHDIAYLLAQVPAGHCAEIFSRYLEKMQQHGYLRGVTLQEAQRRLESGVLYQQLVRARSNASFIGIRPDPYHRQEFEAALTSLAKLLIR